MYSGRAFSRLCAGRPAPSAPQINFIWSQRQTFFSGNHSKSPQRQLRELVQAKFSDQAVQRGIRNVQSGFLAARYNLQKRALPIQNGLLSARGSVEKTILPVQHLVQSRINNWLKDEPDWAREMRWKISRATNFGNGNGNFNRYFHGNVVHGIIIANCLVFFVWDGTNQSQKMRQISMIHPEQLGSKQLNFMEANFCSS